MRTPALRVLTVTWNSRDEVAGLLASLRGAGVDDRDLVVVDNASSDGTVEHVRRAAPAAQVLQTGRNAGYGAAINRGLREVGDDEPVLVLNPDVRLHPGLVAALRDVAEDPTVGVVAPRLLDPDGATAPSVRRDPTWWRTVAEAVLGGRRAGGLGIGEAVVPPPTTATDADWVTGAAMLLAPRARARVPAWEEDYFLYSEEVDYCQRVRDGGLRVVYCPQAVAEHTGGDMEVADRLWALRAVNRVLHVRRTAGVVAGALFHLASVLFESRRAAAGHAPARAALDCLLARDLVARRDALLPDDVDAPLATPPHVVVVARDAAGTLATTLASLCDGATSGELDLLVVVGRSADDTAAIARGVVGDAAVIEVDSTDRAALLRAAEDRLGIPDDRVVVHLDADVRLTARGLRRLVRLAERPDVEVATPTPRLAPTTGSWLVRSLARLWLGLRRDATTTFATGARALAPAGRRRVGDWPDGTEPDAWVTARVPRHRRHRAPDVRVDVAAPPSVAVLVRGGPQPAARTEPGRARSGRADRRPEDQR